MKEVAIEERQLRNRRSAWNEEERKVSREYQKLKKEFSEMELDNDNFEKILDRMETLEEKYPDTILLGFQSSDQSELMALREEKAILNYLKRSNVAQKQMAVVPKFGTEKEKTRR